MCGICGVVEKAGAGLEERQALMRNMLKVIRHRGPDDSGAYFDEGVSLGVNRLSIIDIPGGHQPLSNEDGTVHIVFNGEIYNFPKLRQRLLGKGHCFKTNSDTEVIVHLYEDMGAECVDELNGMFAFAVWDKKSRRLTLCRDRFGIKPLYYMNIGGKLIFASEVKSILQHPSTRREIDLLALSQYLTHEYVPSPNSIFKNINKLPAGHALSYQNGEASLYAYWDLHFSEQKHANIDETECVAEFGRIFEESVKRHLISEVPVGVFLSGGIDSSTIVSFVRRVASNGIKTFFIGFNEGSFDESEYSAAMAKSFNTEHHSTIFNARRMLNILPEVVSMLDEPFGDASVFPTYYLSKFARKEITVALGGDGGDELLLGYPTYQAHKLARYYEMLPLCLRKCFLEKVFERLPVSMENISLDYRLKKFIAGIPYPWDLRHVAWMGSFSPDEKKGLLSPGVLSGLKGEAGLSRYIGRNDREFDSLWDRLQYLDVKTYLQDDILFKMDRASMANSLEIRVPYLDLELVDFLRNIPSRYKFNGLKTKYLLKKAMAGVLPGQIVRRKKKGFGVPVAFWIKNELKDVVFELLSEEKIKKQGLFNHNYISSLLNQHFSNKKDNRKEIWTLLMFELWYKEYMGA